MCSLHCVMLTLTSDDVMRGHSMETDLKIKNISGNTGEV